MNRTDLQKLSRLRIQEARGLFRMRLYSGAYYLAGYSVECALKACIAKKTEKFEFPNKARVLKSYVHKPSELFEVAELASLFESARRNNAKLQASWGVVNNWSEQSRYTIWNRADANAMIDAVGKLQDGVLPWIKLHW
jgi:hypothetical protein